MPYYFFFSYSRDNNDSHLQQFFKDLSEKVCEKLGIDKKSEVGFFDQQSLQLGDDWNEKLERAIQSAPVLVSLYSPAYFNSEFCGKEWECFARRQQLYVDKAREAGQKVGLPAVIKPVIWIPLLEGEEPPLKVRGPQYMAGNPAARHNVDGLKEMRRFSSDNFHAYDAFINDLANAILNTVKSVSLPQGARLLDWLGMDPPTTNCLPSLDPFPSWDKIDNAFVTSVPAIPTIPPTRRRRLGPKFVRFVVVAADPSEFPPGGRQPQFYLDYGGAEWKPFFPQLKNTLMSVAQMAAGEINVHSDELLFDVTLPHDVREIEKRKSLVIIFVDGWTAELPRYGNVLRMIDMNRYSNCSVLVPWNERDDETKARLEHLKNLLRKDIFFRLSSGASARESIFFCDSIDSVETFRERLQVTLRELQCLIREDVMDHATVATIPRSIPSDIPKPVLSHKDPVSGGSG